MLKIFFVCIFVFSFISIGYTQDVNSPAPDFTAKDLNGNSIKLSDLKGKVIVLDFWASWCIPCKKSMPYLIELYDSHQADSLIVLGINVDTQLDKIKEFQSAINTEITFPVIFDNDAKIPPIYNVEAMPTTIVINKEGIIKYKEVGFNNDIKDKLDKTVKDLLAK
jgi:thiol-disulfide isomerase/thioredoxin